MFWSPFKGTIYCVTLTLVPLQGTIWGKRCLLEVPWGDQHTPRVYNRVTDRVTNRAPTDRALTDRAPTDS